MYPCEMKEQDARHVLSVRFRASVQDLPRHFDRIYGSIIQYLETLGEQPTGEPFAAYFNMDMQNLDIEAGFPVAKPLPGKGDIQSSAIPGGMAAVCHYTGPYDGVGPAYEQLSQFIKDQGYTPIGPAYEWYLSEPDVPSQDIRTDLMFPVRAL